jgi:hypothetical protein
MIIDPVCQAEQRLDRDVVVCGGGARNSGDFAIENRLRLSDMALSRMPDTGFRVSFTLTAERPRP